jgi:hypothetical protein
LGCTRHTDIKVVEKKVFIKPTYINLKKFNRPKKVTLDVTQNKDLIILKGSEFHSLRVYIKNLNNTITAYEKEIDTYTKFKESN